MRGLKRREWNVDPSFQELRRAIRPAYEGIETWTNLVSGDTQFLGRAIRPAYEGIETWRRSSTPTVWRSIVARSAPPMRGLKQLSSWESCKNWAFCRAIRPAYEGIETQRRDSEYQKITDCRAIRPAYEGIETSLPSSNITATAISRAIRPAYEGIETYERLADEINGNLGVARSAPPMRGLKPDPRSNFNLPDVLSRAIRPAYEGIETR